MYKNTNKNLKDMKKLFLFIACIALCANVMQAKKMSPIQHENAPILGIFDWCVMISFVMIVFVLIYGIIKYKNTKNDDKEAKVNQEEGDKIKNLTCVICDDGNLEKTNETVIHSQYKCTTCGNVYNQYSPYGHFYLQTK